MSEEKEKKEKAPQALIIHAPNSSLAKAKKSQ